MIQKILLHLFKLFFLADSIFIYFKKIVMRRIKFWTTFFKSKLHILTFFLEKLFRKFFLVLTFVKENKVIFRPGTIIVRPFLVKL